MSRFFLASFLLLVSACDFDGKGTTEGPIEIEQLTVTFVSGHLGRDCSSGSGLVAGDQGICEEGVECPDIDACEDGMVMLQLENSGTAAVTGLSIADVDIVAEGHDVPDVERVLTVTRQGSGVDFDGTVAAGETIQIRVSFRGPRDGDLDAGGLARAIIRLAMGSDTDSIETPELIFVPNVAT